jgi:hypothetical protein
MCTCSTGYIVDETGLKCVGKSTVFTHLSCLPIPTYPFLPTHLPTYPPTYLPTYQPTYLPTYLLPTPSYLPAYLPTYLPTSS